MKWVGDNMGWADKTISELKEGETSSLRPRGHSMEPIIKSGALVSLSPVLIQDLKVGDIVLCRVMGETYLHLVKALSSDGRAQIGNNKGRINGWTSIVYGRVNNISN